MRTDRLLHLLAAVSSLPSEAHDASLYKILQLVVYLYKLSVLRNEIPRMPQLRVYDIKNRILYQDMPLREPSVI